MLMFSDELDIMIKKGSLRLYIKNCYFVMVWGKRKMFRQFLNYRDLYFPDSYDIEGEVQKITLIEGNALLLRSGIVHAVRTLEHSFALGINFIENRDLRKLYKISVMYGLMFAIALSGIFISVSFMLLFIKLSLQFQIL